MRLGAGLCCGPNDIIIIESLHCSPLFSTQNISSNNLGNTGFYFSPLIWSRVRNTRFKIMFKNVNLQMIISLSKCQPGDLCKWSQHKEELTDPLNANTSGIATLIPSLFTLVFSPHKPWRTEEEPEQRNLRFVFPFVLFFECTERELKGENRFINSPSLYNYTVITAC